MRAVSGVDGLAAEGTFRPVGGKALAVAIQALPLASLGGAVRFRVSVSDHKEREKAHHWTAKDGKGGPGKLIAPALSGHEPHECRRENPAHNRFWPHGRGGACGKKGGSHRPPVSIFSFQPCQPSGRAAPSDRPRRVRRRKHYIFQDTGIPPGEVKGDL